MLGWSRAVCSKVKDLEEVEGTSNHVGASLLTMRARFAAFSHRFELNHSAKTASMHVSNI